jgi:hypothetical protein
MVWFTQLACLDQLILRMLLVLYSHDHYLEFTDCRHRNPFDTWSIHSTGACSIDIDYAKKRLRKADQIHWTDAVRFAITRNATSQIDCLFTSRCAHDRGIGSLERPDGGSGTPICCTDVLVF